MDPFMIQASPCPLCGEVAFALDSWSPPLGFSEYACLWDNEASPLDAHLQPCECTGCGNVQMVVTRS
jgi:hypothetical protein